MRLIVILLCYLFGIRAFEFGSTVTWKYDIHYGFEYPTYLRITLPSLWIDVNDTCIEHI